ncbi:hypothetical protein HMPREF9944_01702 [Segatella maculosa OT 289]|uniref:Uncharacterized protein n=1 Tax=Segatella maculosa OT 289 TaxID=999422 RepID=H1HNF8_9BACT|nr:hypothetical protein HMPREF9944_01702 [Segatella maculosa OT 289]
MRKNRSFSASFNAYYLAGPNKRQKVVAVTMSSNLSTKLPTSAFIPAFRTTHCIIMFALNRFSYKRCT